MKAFLSILKLLLVVFAGFFLQPVSAQTGVLDPNDPVITYNPNNPPTRPDNGVLAKWVRTKRMSWNTDSYKCYFYKNYAFRLKYPKSYQPGVNDGKKYPVFVFFHGAGELGTFYDNEYQLLHGGELHKNAVDNGQFDGYLIYPQSRDPGWSNAVYDVMNEFIMKYLVPEAKADPYRIMDDGLSSGGAATWNFLIKYPKLIAASLPISATYMPDTNYISSYKYTPIWHFQGGVDVSPQPFNSVLFGNKVLSHGGNYRYTEYPNVGHGCWYNAWGEPDYFPFMLRANKVNPWPLYGRTEFCTLDEINVTIGVTEGFDGYEWRKNGTVIPGANSNTYLVKNEIGTYDCRIKSGNEWSYWSPTPVVIKLKQKTITPNIQLSGFTSKVIPAPDGNTVSLMLPEGYTSYLWQKEGSETILGTSREYIATTPGYYKAKVTELYGCSSEYSELFKILDANGANGPDAPSDIIATTLSRTSIRIDWNQNANPQNNETGFEVFRGAASAGPYQLVTITAPDAASYTDKKLNPGTQYFYKVRAINNNGASSVPNAVQATTQRDTTAPTAPGNLKVVSFSGNSVSLSWNASSDDVEVTNYDVYVNGIRMYILGGNTTAFTVYNLTYGKTYNFIIKARDFAGNVSVASNQATATPYLKGLNYSYYNGEWNKLPDFKLLTPVAIGVVPNVTLNTYSDAENYAYLWEGTITIPVNGNYTFRTNSDDGSRLYLGANGGTSSPYSFSATPLVDNDGLHGSQDANSVVRSLTAGTYPIAISFFQLGGGASMNVYWRNPQTGNQFVAIPDSAFTDGFKVTGTAPAAPSDLKALAISSKRIDLSWTDNSDNETGFEIYRANSSSGPYLTIAITSANKTSYIDSSLNAATTYYYRIRAIGKYGESAFNDANNSLKYSYYEGSYAALPDFNALTPKKTGDINNFDISVADAQDYFAFKFDGIIRVPVDGNYTFYTTSDDGSKLYINGTSESNLVVNNDGLHGTVEASGNIFLTAGAHSIRVAFFEAAGDQVLKVAYQGPGIAKQLIPDSVLGLPGANATTLKISGVPTAPTNLVVEAQSPSVMKINWTDNSSQETGFEIYRSQASNNNYVLITTVAANLQNYFDSNLIANTIYYYKVRAKGLVGPSEYTDEAYDTTLNNPPTIASIGNQSMRYGTQLIVNVAASDIDGDQLMLTVDGLPSFGFFTSTGNGTGTITFNPQASDEKVYTGITVTVSDPHGGTKTISFNLTVNDNYNPVIGAIAPVTVQEGSSYTLVLNATDQNAGDILTWDFPDLPSFITKTVNGGSATLLIKPGFADADVYHITARVMDNKGGSDTKTFSVLVTKGMLPTQKIYVNFGYGAAYNEGAPWNNTNQSPLVILSLSHLKMIRGLLQL